MKIENQVCSIEQGEKLEKLGIKAKPQYCHCWVNESNGESKAHILLCDLKIEGLPDLATTWIAPAYNVAELGKMLPVCIDDLRIRQSSIDRGDTDNYSIQYRNNRSEYATRTVPDRAIFAPTEAQLRAAILIFILEEKLVTPDDVDNRLINS